MEVETTQRPADISVVLPDGTELPGSGPIVIVGPNGSGKTKLSRRLTERTTSPLEFINALRNTRMSQQLPAMSKLQALQQHDGVRNTARDQPWELASDFDYVLSQLLADDGDAARSYRQNHKAGRDVSDAESTALEIVENLWKRIFPGRSLEWKDWSPLVHNERQEASYRANEMSDGERAALYLLSKVLLAAAGTVLVIDEPETHFHSRLAVRLWDELEKARQDLRFVYVTHDLVFGLSREPADFLLADPLAGLTRVAVDQRWPNEVRREILGAASFSYYASRVVFCEGADHSYDRAFLSSWWNQRDTVVVPVGSCDAVRQCVEAFRAANVFDNLEAIGVVDRDYYPDERIAAFGESILTLPLHEIEGILCLPDIVNVLANHLAIELGEPPDAIVRHALDADAERRVAHERAKQRILNAIEDRIVKKPVAWDETTVRQHFEDIDKAASQALSAQLRFDEELAKVVATRSGSDVYAILAVFPSKPLAAAIARALKMPVSALFDLLNSALRAQSQDDALYALGQNLERQLAVLGLPQRSVEERELTATTVASS